MYVHILYVCTYIICMYIYYMYVHILYVCTYIICMYIYYMYVHIFIYVCTYMYICMYTEAKRRLHVSRIHKRTQKQTVTTCNSTLQSRQHIALQSTNGLT
jgi:hypothetical protein